MNAQRLIRFTSFSSVAISVILIAIKLYAFVKTGSNIVLSSLVDSTIDALSSLLNYVAVIYAMKPSDADHRFGHNAIEDIAGLAQGCFIFGSAILIIVESIKNAVNNTVAVYDDFAMHVMFASLCLTGILVLLQTYSLRYTKSLVLASDYLHYKTDILMNIAVITALFLTKITEIRYLDSIFASAIAIYIMHSAYDIGKNAFNNLMCREVSDDMHAKIVNVLHDPRIYGFHKLKTRRAGSACFVQVHLEIDKSMSFIEAHVIADDIEKKILSIIECGDVIVHKDPWNGNTSSNAT